ncbi:MAG TPA: outer membrane protein assembly factor BamD [Nitrospirae bacterium]|nr:outer membrane protein assembly factor BamD [Nitrospirota bacterium]
MKQLFFSLVLFVSTVSFLLVSCTGEKAVRHAVFDPKAVLQQASKLIKKDEYEEARKLLFEVKNRDLSKKYAPLAQLKIAESFVLEGQPKLAVEEYRRFLQLYPDHPRAPYAQYQIALVHFKQIEGPERGAGGARKALEEFQKLLRLYPRNPYREVVELKINKCRNLIAEYEFLVGKFYYKKAAYNAAIGRFLGLLREFPDYKKTPEVLYLTGISYRELNRTDESLQYLNKLTKGFPESEFTKKAEKVMPATTQ